MKEQHEPDQESENKSKQLILSVIFLAHAKEHFWFQYMTEHPAPETPALGIEDEEEMSYGSV